MSTYKVVETSMIFTKANAGVHRNTITVGERVQDVLGAGLTWEDAKLLKEQNKGSAIVPEGKEHTYTAKSKQKKASPAKVHKKRVRRGRNSRGEKL